MEPAKKYIGMKLGSLGLSGLCRPLKWVLFPLFNLAGMQSRPDAEAQVQFFVSINKAKKKRNFPKSVFSVKHLHLKPKIGRD